MGAYEAAVEGYGKKAADETAELCRELGIDFNLTLCECVHSSGLENTEKALKGLEDVRVSVLEKINFIRTRGIKQILAILPLPKSPFSPVETLNILSHLSFRKTAFEKVIELYKEGYPLCLCLEIIKFPDILFYSREMQLLKHFDVFFNSNYDPRLNELASFLQMVIENYKSYIPRRTFDSLLEQLSEPKFFKSKIDKIISREPEMSIDSARVVLKEIEKLKESSFNFCIAPHYYEHIGMAKDPFEAKHIQLLFVPGAVSDKAYKLYADWWDDYYYNVDETPFFGKVIAALWKLGDKPILWISQIQQSGVMKSLKILGSPKLRGECNRWRSYMFDYIEKSAKKAKIDKIVVSTPEVVEKMAKAYKWKIPPDAIEQNYGKKTMARFGYRRSEAPLTLKYIISSSHLEIANYFYVKEL